jgi:hypothetical protein
LSQLAHAGGDERLTDALARWTTQVWHAEDELPEQPRALTCYIDGHRKPVYTNVLIPRGLVGRLSTILGCRALVLLHDAQGQVAREVACARIALPLPDHPGEVLPLGVALIRDLRRSVPVQPCPQDTERPQRWDADLSRSERQWWEEGWQATAAPTTEITPKLIPIVTTAETFDAVELAQTYIHRWPAQENVIKDYLRPLGLDTNHGFAKTPVENSEVAKRRGALQKREASLKQWAQSASKREAQAGKRHDRLRIQFKSRADELYRELGLYQTTLEMQEVPDHLLRREIKERKAIIDAELEQLRTKMWRAYEQCNQEFRKQERYCKEQRDILRSLEDLEATERTMYELDHRKDQIMTVCKVALANLVMWSRDHYFPATYAHATWQRLLPFFRLAGRVMQEADVVQVELRPFNDRQLNRDLATLCARVNAAAPRLPDGRQLQLTLDFPAIRLVRMGHCWLLRLHCLAKVRT